jgi:hypothetical protein
MPAAPGEILMLLPKALILLEPGQSTVPTTIQRGPGNADGLARHVDRNVPADQLDRFPLLFGEVVHTVLESPRAFIHLGFIVRCRILGEPCGLVASALPLRVTAPLQVHRQTPRGCRQPPRDVNGRPSSQVLLISLHAQGQKADDKFGPYLLGIGPVAKNAAGYRNDQNVFVAAHKHVDGNRAAKPDERNQVPVICLPQ